MSTRAEEKKYPTSTIVNFRLFLIVHVPIALFFLYCNYVGLTLLILHAVPNLGTNLESDVDSVRTRFYCDFNKPAETG